jgi:hypothetical protein
MYYRRRRLCRQNLLNPFCLESVSAPGRAESRICAVQSPREDGPQLDQRIVMNAFCMSEICSSSRPESVHVLPADSVDLFVRLIGPGVSLSVRGVPLLRLSLAGWRL